MQTTEQQTQPTTTEQTAARAPDATVRAGLWVNKKGTKDEYVSLSLPGMETMRAFKQESKQAGKGRTPDYRGTGIAVWENQKDNRTWYSCHVDGFVKDFSLFVGQ